MRKQFVRGLTGVAIGLLISQSAVATHFRGGTIIWEPADLDGDGQINDLNVTVTSYWRCDFVEDFDLVIRPERDIVPIDDQIRFHGGEETAENSDYAMRTQVFDIHDLDVRQLHTLVFAGGDRISTLHNNADGRWALQATVYMDYGNLRPELNMPVYMHVPQVDEAGETVADWQYDVSVPDRNGNKVKYRLANLSEIGGKVGYVNPEGLTVDEDSGVITWEGSGALEPGLYSGGIVAEDFSSNGRKLSRTHLDFILNLGDFDESQASCGAHTHDGDEGDHGHDGDSPVDPETDPDAGSSDNENEVPVTGETPAPDSGSGQDGEGTDGEGQDGSGEGGGTNTPGDGESGGVDDTDTDPDEGTGSDEDGTDSESGADPEIDENEKGDNDDGTGLESPANPDGNETPRLRTAVKGGGASGSGALLLFGGLLAAARFRRCRPPKRLALAVTMALTQGASVAASAAEQSGCRADKGSSNCWYAGVGGGVSQLDPEGSSNGWSTDDDQGAGYEVHIGQQFTPHWYWEFNYAEPGEAGLGNPDPALAALIPDAAIEYKIPSLSAGYYLWNRSDGWNLYGKAGISAIDTKSNSPAIEVDQESSVQWVFGAGVQYRFKNSPWFSRLEFTNYDRDAKFVALKVSRSFGYQPVRTAAKDQGIEVVPAADHSTGNACPNTPPTMVVSEKECAFFNNVIQGVHFGNNSIELSIDAANHLLNAVQQLKANSTLKIEVQAHTDSVGDDEYNQWLSEQRAEAVRQFLLDEGVPGEQVSARGYGESQPVATNETPQGRARNRRVEFRIMDEN